MELEEITKRLRIWEKGERVGPVRIELHLTDKCNLNCIFCWRAVQKPKGKKELSKRKVLEIVREAAELKVKEWIVSGGGEPLMRKNVTFTALKEIKKYKMWGLLTTNGTLLKEKDANFLVKIGWDQVQLSIDGPNPKINDFLRPPKSFTRIMKAIEYLKKAKKLNKSSKPIIGFNTIINKLNYDKLDEMIELAYGVGVDLVYFEPIYPGYSKIDLKIPENKKELIKNVKKADKLAKKLKVSTNVREFLEYDLLDKTDLRKKMLEEVKNIKGFKGVPCFRPWYLMGVKASGFTGCCSTFERGEFIQGKSLKEVWFGKVFNQLRKEMLEKKQPDYCSKCSVVVLMENRRLREMLNGRKN